MSVAVLEVEFAEKLQALSEIDPSLLSGAVEMFCRQASSLVRTLDGEVAVGNAARITACARALADLCDGVGAIALGRIARCLEEEASGSPLQQSWLLTAAERECARTCEAMHSFV